MFHVEGQGDRGRSCSCRSTCWLLPCSWPPHCPCWLQVFHCHFNSNFFPLFLEHLLSDHISLSTGSFLLGEWVPWAGRKDKGLHPRTPSPAVGTAASPAGARVAEGRIRAGVAPPAPCSVFQRKGGSLCGFEGVGLPSWWSSGWR